MIAAVLEDSTWMEDAVATIVGLSRKLPEFTADDLRKEMRPAPHDKMPGLAFGQARRRGLIESAVSTTSTAKSRNHGSLKVWRRKQEGVTK